MLQDNVVLLKCDNFQQLLSIIFSAIESYSLSGYFAFIAIAGRN